MPQLYHGESLKSHTDIDDDAALSNKM